MSAATSTLRALLVGTHVHGARAVEDLLGIAVAPHLFPPFSQTEARRVDSLGAAQVVLRGAWSPQVILTDLDLSDSLGLETFQRLRQAAGTTPIIVLSEFEDDPVALQAVHEGAQDCLPEGKIDSSILLRSIRHALARFDNDDAGRRSHASFRETLEASDLPSLVVDASGEVLFSNSAAGDILGGQPRRVVWDDRGDEWPRIQLDGAVFARPDARRTDTLWDRQLAVLITLEGRSARGPVVSSTIAEPAFSLFEGLVSASPRMRALFGTCERIAATSASVLLLGETGTGKELIARAIHSRSGRTGRFVALDCGAVPEALVDSELFGHERGAFTGATTRKLGLFRHAHRGTLLLDEITNMPLASQNSLLRVLQEGVVRPVGGADEIKVDVRIIAATSAALLDAVQERRFREDLLYRLDVIRLELLPLRERPEDVVHMFQLFNQRLAGRHGLEPLDPGPGFLQAAVDFPWPGNIRQLEHFVERLLLTAAPCIGRRDFHELMQASRPTQRDRTEQPAWVDTELSLSAFLAEQEQAYLEELLQETNGSLQATADRAGVDARTIRRKLQRLGIDRLRFLR